MLAGLPSPSQHLESQYQTKGNPLESAKRHPALSDRLSAGIAAKHVWRARIILLSDDGLGTIAVMAETGRTGGTESQCIQYTFSTTTGEGPDGVTARLTDADGEYLITV